MGLFQNTYKKISHQIKKYPSSADWNLKAINSAFAEGKITEVKKAELERLISHHQGLPLAQRIYFSRHGLTYSNKATKKRGGKYSPSIKERKKDRLTYKGKHQAKKLGKYLKSKIHSNEKIIIITSNSRRTGMTVDYVLKRFHKETQIETVEKVSLLNEIDPEEVSLKNEKYWPLKATPSQVEYFAKPRINKILEILSAHPDKTAIIILHSGVNHCILRYLNENHLIIGPFKGRDDNIISKKKQQENNLDYSEVQDVYKIENGELKDIYIMSNCSLIVFERAADNRLKLIQDYIKNSELGKG